MLLDIEPKNVILIGDSAGGNLVCALTIKLIKSKGRIPDGLVLAYPGDLLFFYFERMINVIISIGFKILEIYTKCFIIA